MFLPHRYLGVWDRTDAFSGWWWRTREESVFRFRWFSVVFRSWIFRAFWIQPSQDCQHYLVIFIGTLSVLYRTTTTCAFTKLLLGRFIICNRQSGLYTLHPSTRILPTGISVGNGTIHRPQHRCILLHSGGILFHISASIHVHILHFGSAPVLITSSGDSTCRSTCRIALFILLIAIPCHICITLPCGVVGRGTTLCIGQGVQYPWSQFFIDSLPLQLEIRLETRGCIHYVQKCSGRDIFRAEVVDNFAGGGECGR